MTLTPAPARGLMFVECGTCGVSLPSMPVDLGDPAEGMTSHGLCGPCERLAWAETEAYLKGMGLTTLPGGIQ